MVHVLRCGGPGGTVAPLPAPSNGALTKVLVEAAKSGANVAAMAAALASETKTSIRPLPSVRLTEGFEHLRDAGDAFKAQYGQNAKIFLANIGTAAAFTARASYAKNFFEAGGIEAVAGTGGEAVTDIVRDFRASGASFAAVCGTDAAYTDVGAKIVSALKDAGAAVVYLAGRGGDTEAALRAAGVDAFIFVGCDVRAVLDQAHQRLKAGK